jgi:signal recognition particle subunit SRP72
MERFAQSRDVYKQLLDAAEPTDGFYKELQANYLAAQAAAVLAHQDITIDIVDVSTYEGAYNLGCVYLGLGHLEKASELLEKARELGRRALLNDEVTEEEINQELAIIAVQLAYVYQLQGKNDEAHELVEDIIKSKYVLFI